jgi:hypothetical protein
MSLSDLRSHPPLAGVITTMEQMVIEIRPLAIVHELDAVRQLLRLFAEDPDRAVTVAAVAMVELARLHDWPDVGRSQPDVTS